MTRDGKRAFTIIELLMVIAIIMTVAAMALPYFVEMQKSRKWSTAVANVQSMVWRARSLATNVRKDFAVEFYIAPDCTTMWVEAESNLLERLPDIDWLEHQLGGGGAIAWIYFGDWYYAGGTAQWAKYECHCKKCLSAWVVYSPADPAVACPNCNAPYYPYVSYETYYYNFQMNPSLARSQDYGDNSRQSEYVSLAGGLVIDDSAPASPNFVNWDAPPPNGVRVYGYDNTKDIRLAPNGALVQTSDPTICIKQISGAERIRLQVVRCTGRLKKLPQ